METNEDRPVGRRALLGAAIGGAAAAATAAIAAPVSVFADNGNPVMLGQDNTATATTMLVSSGGHAVSAQAEAGDGIRGWTNAANCSGVFGYANTPTAFGVYGKCGGRGVAALGTYDAALWASNAGYTAPLAMKIQGPAQFSRSGRVTVPKGVRKVKLPVAPVTSATFGIATVQQLRTGTYVQCVANVSGAMYVYLSKAAPAATSVAWMVFERP